ncbi:MAG TPA: sensor domain-containing diguanylate cyclase [Janthinobacterium sp.]|nr:sensor domain-containing diguanylate cyclase [Janthinobacterium sp.]
MELFALDEELASWEAELPPPGGLPRLMLLARLAWHLRQRDSARALTLAREAQTLLDLLPEERRRSLRARLMLVEAESLWLFARLDPAHALASEALREFDLGGDLTGAADAHWLLAWIAVDGGHSAACDAELGLAAMDARAAGDAARSDIIDATAALFAAFGGLETAHERWGQRFAPEQTQLHTAAAGWIGDFFATIAFQASDFGRAVGHWMHSYEIATASGQPRRAVNIATNIGNAFTSLNAHDAALEWMQRGLDLARSTGWPMSVAMSLMQTAETLRQLGRSDAARELLDEAQGILAPLPGSRAYAIFLEYQGNLALDLGQYDTALRSFTQLEARGEALQQSDFQSCARRGQAHALSHLGRSDEALAAAAAALDLARRRSDAYNEIAALKVQAEIHARHARSALSDPQATAAPNAALHYLQQALALAATIEGYTVPGDLLDAAAREHAQSGDYAKAYEIALQAGAARDKTHSMEATKRAIAMQVQYQTERAQTEGEHHRQLAVAEAQRAEVLQQTSATLEHLSAIGQEITAHLDASAVFRALDRHVRGLLDATHFSIFLLETDGHHLGLAFGMEAGAALPAARFSLAETQLNSVRCVRERREILIEIAADATTPNLIPGTLQTLSLLFAPLLIGERVLGVMTVQSLRPQAYGGRERLIFRALCTNGAIALDNASAYRQVEATLKALNATQKQLLEKNLELERAYTALEEVSLTDQLTGLRNRRFFLQHVDADVAMSLRAYDQLQHDGAASAAGQGKDLVFFMVDLDHFKEVNDKYGHAAGDSVLMQMQERLREVFRESDYLIRWGGEEFLVLARATHRDDARLVAERIRAAVANRPFVLPDGLALPKTCSIGFACFPFLTAQPRLLSWSQVVELADQSLYIAKKSGRNAWAALYGTALTQPEGLFARLLQQLECSLRDGQVVLVSNLACPPVLAGDKPPRPEPRQRHPET